MTNAGSLIQLHNHNNFELLEFLTIEDGFLHYDSVPIYAPISKDDNNIFERRKDGYFVDGSGIANNKDILEKFTYKDGVLYYNGRVVATEYADTQIETMVDEIWDSIEKTISTANKE